MYSYEPYRLYKAKTFRNDAVLGGWPDLFLHRSIVPLPPLLISKSAIIKEKETRACLVI